MSGRINRHIPRRTFLRGLGTALALPLLDGMVPLRSFAATSGTASAAAGTTAASAGAAAAKQLVKPNRLLFLFVPNGMHMPDWRPGAEGELNLPWIMEPLKNVKEHLTVMSGLAQNNARALGDGGGDHARSAAVWLTGAHPRKTSGADIKAGISVDQLAAQQIGHLTRFPSLELGCERGAQAGNCDSGYSCAYSSSVSWRSESTPVAKEVNPRLVFERLFGNGDGSEEYESRARRDSYRKSILDFVSEDTQALKSQLGVHDVRKLDEYFTGIREMELRLAKVEQINAATVGSASKPNGIPTDYGEHIRLMSDMLVLALQADLTRVSTFMFANDGSNRSYRSIGVPEGHHEVSHHGGDKAKQEKIRTINRFHVTQLAYLLEKMKATKEGDGNLLDNSMLIYGAGISDGDRHNHNDLPILMAGKGAGTITTNRHIKYEQDTPLNNLFLSLLERMDIHSDHLGDSTGRLDKLA